MNIRKLEAFEEFENRYPDKVQYYANLIAEKVDVMTIDYIKLLTELCYKEGYKDGYRFCDWLHENTL